METYDGPAGELVNNAAAGGIPQKGDVFIPCRCGSYPVGCFVVRFAPVGSHFHKEIGEAQSDPMVQELQHPSDEGVRASVSPLVGSFCTRV